MTRNSDTLSHDAFVWIANPRTREEADRQSMVDTYRQTFDDQFNGSWDTYQTIAETLNGSWLGRILSGRRKVPVVSREIARAALDDWLTDERLEHVADASLTDSERFYRLVVTPNTPVSPGQLESVGKKLSRYKSISFAGAAALRGYNISGFDPDGGDFRFALVPTTPTDNTARSAAEQRAMLTIEQNEASVPLRPPNPLEIFARWYIMAHRPGEREEQAMRHFDLRHDDPTQPRDTREPVSTISADGQHLRVDLEEPRLPKRGYLAIA